MVASSTLWARKYPDRHRAQSRLSMQKWRMLHPDKAHEVVRRSATKRISFKGKRIFLNNFPRIGKCSQCGNTRATDMHHEKGYYMIFPWYGIIELCNSCHAKIGVYEVFKRKGKWNFN